MNQPIQKKSKENRTKEAVALPTTLLANGLPAVGQRLRLLPKWWWVAGLIFVVIGGGVLFWRSRSKGAAVATYQTATVEMGTLVNSVSATGTVTNGAGQSIMTQASGVVQKVYVKNGDTVKKGQKIAEIALDQDGQERQAAAWSSYLSAKNQLASAQAKLHSLQSAAFKANQKFITDAVARDLVDTDPTYIQQNADWLQAEADYKNQSGVITQAQAAVNNNWISYQQTMGTIVAPAAGVVGRLTLVPGLVINTSATSTNSSGASSQKVGVVLPTNARLQISVNLAEIDVAKVLPDQPVTITFDAASDKTYTGKVMIVDTNGSVSSGVTSYLATIQLDNTVENIYPNMAATAQIITNVQKDVLLVPTAAVQTNSGQSTVYLWKNGQAVPTTVTTGGSDDTNTAILTGLQSGDVVVTNPMASTKKKTTTTTATTSVFSSMGRMGGGPGR